MVEVFRTGNLDSEIVIFPIKDFEAQVEKWSTKTGIKITKYYKQVVSNGVIIASFIPKKDETNDKS